MRLVIDADILLYSCGFVVDKDFNTRNALSVFGQDQVPVSHVMQAIKMKIGSIHNEIAKNHGINELTLAVSPEGSTFRYEVAKTKGYKANRDNLAKPSRFKESKERLLKTYPCKVVEGLEGDDVCGILLSDPSRKTILATLDKDLDMIPGLHYNWNRRSIYSVTHTEAYRNFCLQLLIGDSVDNIPGCYGVGKVKAHKLLDGVRDKSEMVKRVIQEYKNKGHSKEYFVEQATLVWIMRKLGEKFDETKISHENYEGWA